ncbi:MAG: GNAT family N-acetyltransferase [Altererythrobacter sp.]|nr:GNAT family N-acetyltransferase [Altererythrobacter sp.]
MFHRTERLLLRPAWPEDWEMILWGIGDERMVRNLAKAPWPYLPEHAQEFARRGQDPRFPSFLLTLPESRGARLIGCAGLGETATGVELGYWIARPYWNRGYATEGARGVIEIARLLGHPRIEAGHYLDNPASGRVLRKLGFQPTGAVRRRDCVARGEPTPCANYALDLQPEEMPARAA